MKDLDIRFETVKLIKDKQESKLQDTCIGMDLLNRIQIAQEIRLPTDQQELTKLKVFCTAKGMATK